MDGIRRKTFPPKPPPRIPNVPQLQARERVQARERATKTPLSFPKTTEKKTGSQKRITRTILRGMFFVGAFALVLFGYFSWKVGQATHRMNSTAIDRNSLSDTIAGAQSLIAPVTHPRRALLQGEIDGRTNILLLGKANEQTAGQKLTDTIMVLSLDHNRKKVGLLSLPRDLFVSIPETSLSVKLNAIYQYDARNGTGAETIRSAVTEITGLPLHYFVVIDYEGFISIINAVGGISVYVERDLFDPNYPGPNYSYETFEIKKGWQDIDGETALKYVRERHADPQGDFGRAKRQQEVLVAIRDKVFSLKTFLNPLAIGNIIDAVGKHIRTNLSLSEIQSFVELAKEFDTKNIESAVVDAWKKESLLRVSHVQMGTLTAFILVPRTGDWSEIRELAENIFDIHRIQERRQIIEAENATIAIQNESGSPLLGPRIQKLLLNDFGMPHVTLLPGPLSTPPARHESFLFGRSGTQSINTLDELAKKLSLNRIERNSDIEREAFAEYDIIITLGEDLAQKFSFAEDSPEDIQKAEDNLEYRKRTDDAFNALPPKNEN